MVTVEFVMLRVVHAVSHVRRPALVALAVGRRRAVVARHAVTVKGAVHPEGVLSEVVRTAHVVTRKLMVRLVFGRHHVVTDTEGVMRVHDLDLSVKQSPRKGSTCDRRDLEEEWDVLRDNSCVDCHLYVRGA